MNESPLTPAGQLSNALGRSATPDELYAYSRGLAEAERARCIAEMNRRSEREVRAAAIQLANTQGRPPAEVVEGATAYLAFLKAGDVAT